MCNNNTNFADDNGQQLSSSVNSLQNDNEVSNSEIV